MSTTATQRGSRGRWQRLADHPCIVDYSRIFADRGTALSCLKGILASCRGFNLQDWALDHRGNRALLPLTLEIKRRTSDDQVWADRSDGSRARGCTRGPGDG